MSTRPVPFCARCGVTAIVLQTRYGERCMCPRCGDYSWDRKPLTDAHTHRARRLAHAAFDPLWRKPALMSRGQAYRLLQDALGLTPEECHMSVMDAETAERVPAAVQEILSRIDPDGERVPIGASFAPADAP